MKATLPNDILERLFRDLDTLPDHARVLITVSHCYLELFVHLMAVHKCKNGKRIGDSNRDYPHSIKIVMLHEAGLISDWESAYLHWFRKQRNKAAHEAEFEITATDLELFTGMKGLVEGLMRGSSLDDPKNIRDLCDHIVVGFWNTHIDFFGQLWESVQNAGLLARMAMRHSDTASAEG